MTQLTDERLLTPEEANLLGAKHDETNDCRNKALRLLSTVRPDLVPILTNAYLEDTNITILLVERKMTWGEAARRTQAVNADLKEEFAAANRLWIADLKASHEAELAQRQTAADAMVQWSAQQQMLNAMNRPVTTACNRMGTFTNCTSR